MIKGGKEALYLCRWRSCSYPEPAKNFMTFAKKVDAPVTDSLMGKGAFPGTDPLYTGMLGMHGTKTSNYGVSECDLLIVIGARFSDRVTGNAQKFAQNAKIIQIDVDAAEMNKNVMITAGVVGDIKVVLDRLNAAPGTAGPCRMGD